MTTLSPILLDPIVLVSDPEVVVARVVLRLTIYTTDPLTWARGHAAEVLRGYLQLVGPRPHYWYTTSRIELWHRITPAGVDEIVDQLCNAELRGPRHQFTFRLADRTDTPLEEFRYREVDGERFGHTGVLELTLDPERSPSDLLQLALTIGNESPFASGVGGYGLAIHPLIQPEGFRHAHTLSKRFLGLDVQHPEAMCREALTGMPGTSWLTLVGKPLTSRIPALEDLRDHEWSSERIALLALRGGLLIRAGDQPTTGDVNALETPTHYHEVAAAVHPYLVPNVEEYPGPFGADEVTRAYLERLTHPDAWSQA